MSLGLELAAMSPHNQSSIEEVKASIPLEWVVGELWGLWGVGSSKVSCPNPNHGDSTPSFNLWSRDGRGCFDSFGCYGCGLRGDVIDVVQITQGLSFPAALDYIDGVLLPKYQASGYQVQEVHKEDVTPDDIARCYNELDRDPQTLLKFLARMQMLPAREYVEIEWRWAGHFLLDCVSIPHLDRDGALTGVKYRDYLDRERRWGILGSRFFELYGAWRDQGRRNVVLCEGESDTVWAAHQLAGRDCDVLGLATGAGQHPTVSNLEELEGREVWIMFDGDEAGDRAAKLWKSRLARGHIVEVPAGEDLMSCNIPVAHLLGLKEDK